MASSRSTRKTLLLPAGSWWRFDRYEIAGTHIRPAATARLLPSDPWRNRRLRARKDVAAPYRALLDLVRECGGLSADGLSDHQKTLITSWCSQNGTLGVLLHRVQMVGLAPTGPSGTGPQPTLVRGPGGWSRVLLEPPDDEVLVAVHHELPSGDEFGHEDGYAVEETYGTVLRGREVLAADLLGDPVRQEDPATTWGRFFPSLPDPCLSSFPTPLSTSFWHLYQEPVADFLEAARALAEALDAVRRSPASAPTAFRALLRTVTPTPAVRGGLFLIDWNSTTLLGSLAMMAYLDLMGGARVIRCKNTKCNAVVVVPGYQTKHCSERCARSTRNLKYNKAIGRKVKRGHRRPPSPGRCAPK